MKRPILCLAPVFVLLFVFLTSCNSGSPDSGGISTDSVSIARGQATFSQQCSACHNFVQDGIGPHLGGITSKAPAGWIAKFITNPRAMLDSGDERTRELFGKYQTLMPAFDYYTKEELADIIAYLHTQQAPDTTGINDGVTGLTNPIEEPIPMSDLVVGLEFIAEMPASSDKGFRTRLNKLGFLPRTNRLFIHDLRGKMFELTTGKNVLYLDMAAQKPDFIDAPGLATGFGSFAFHPAFTENGLLYTTHTEAPETTKADFSYHDSIPRVVQWVVSEWKTETPAAAQFSGRSRELFRINMVTGTHGVQEIAFRPGAVPGDEDYGLLYIGIGDGGSVDSGLPFICHDVTKPWGTVFRIDPAGNNSGNGKYGIPASNPFAGKEGALGEIFAYGFRNPFRLTWTSAEQLLVCNIGQAHIESVNLVEKGLDYGWPIREGTFVLDPYGDLKKVFPLPADDTRFGITYPVAQYDHDEGLAIAGGFEYTGKNVPALKGLFLLADMNNGRLFYFPMTTLRQGTQSPLKEWRVSYQGKVTTFRELCGKERVDLRMGKDRHGEIYFFSKADGKVYRLVVPRAPHA